nr:LysR family transcriptional regulator [uncultured Faecalimonas sp.]
MDLQKMQYFKDVFELNSFTKAADKNFVYQSAVTQQIAALEKELGFQLFIREHGGIENTLEGKIFYEECVKILSEYAALRNKIKDTHEGEKRREFTIGFSGVMEEKFSACISGYSQKRSDVLLNFVEGSYSTLCNKLLNQEIDIIFGTACELENIPGIEWKILFTEKQMVFLSKEHPIAQKEQLSMKDLESEILIVPTIDMVPSCHKKGMELRKKSKYKMDIRFANSFEAVKMQVRNNQGITFTAESFEEYNHQYFKKSSISDIHFICTLGVAYLKNNQEALLYDFLKYVSLNGK